MRQSVMGGLRRTVGTAAGGTLALALLVCGCVFAALAGPALSLHTRTQALQQTLAGYPATTRTVQVTAPWGDFMQAVYQDTYQQPTQTGQALGPGDLDSSISDLARGLAATPLPLAGGNWASLSTNPLGIASAVPPSARADGAPGQPRMEILYRDPFTGYAQLVAGRYAAGKVPAGAVAVTATAPTAARFGLHPGSRLTVAIPSGTATLVVTGIVRPRGAGSTFWTQDSTPARPSLVVPPGQGMPYWVGGVIADSGQLAAIQAVFGGPGLNMQWEFPLAIGGLDADQAQGLYGALNRATTATPRLTGTLTSGVSALTVSSPLLQDLAQFLGIQAAIETVLMLLFVSLTLVGAAVILLAARMIVARRDGELAMLRARGGSLRQVAALMLRAALVAAVPGTVIGAGLAIAVIPGRAGSLAAGWALAGTAVAAALAGPPLIAAWQHRQPAPASNPARITTAEIRRPRVAWRRPVAEITAIAASVAGLVVLHDQGLPASGGGGADLYLAAVPVLVAVPVVLIMLRLYPLAIRGVLAWLARRPGATGFVALSGAARSSLTGVLPAFALVLALSLATFAGMVSQGITRGEVAAAWHTTGADVMIKAGSSGSTVSPGGVRAIAGVRGVRHAAAVWSTDWVTPYGQPVTVAAVDPGSYAALVADTPFPALPAARLGPARTGTAPGGMLGSGPAVPVLASPAAAAVLGPGAVQLSSLQPIGPFKVRVAGILDSTPAEPGGGAFAVMPMQTLPGLYGQPAPNMVLVTGSTIDEARLSAVAGRVFPGSVVTFRSAVLASLASSPLQHGAGLIIALTLATAAAFGLFIVILGLALGSAERQLTLARLTVMGHGRSTGLVVAEAMPAVLAAAVAGAVCAVLLPGAIGSSIDLSAFTGTSAPVRFQPDALALVLPAAAIGVLALAALLAEARAMRRHGVTGLMRAH